MNLVTSDHTLSIAFPSGGTVTISRADIASIDLETIQTMTVDVDLVAIGLKNGEFLEISDGAVGFREACDWLSEAFGIHPAIAVRFPTAEGIRQRVYER